MIVEMKNQSATGATGFGQLSEKELETIQSTVDRLNPDMDKGRFLQSIREVKAHYLLWKEYNDKALAEEAELGISRGAPAAAAPGKTIEELQAELSTL